MQQFFDWLAMGGYSSYVWPAYFLAIGVLVGNVVLLKKQKTSIARKLQDWFKE